MFLHRCINFQFQKQPRSRLRVSYEFEGENEENEADKNILDIDALQMLWNDFSKLMASLKTLPGKEGYLDGPAFQRAARQWGEDFRLVTFDEDVIPYIHCKSR